MTDKEFNDAMRAHGVPENLIGRNGYFIAKNVRMMPVGLDYAFDLPDALVIVPEQEG